MRNVIDIDKNICIIISMDIEYEVGLTQKEGISESFLKYSKNEYLQYQYAGIKTRKTLKLIEFHYIDFILGRRENLKIENDNLDGDTVYLSNIIFSVKEKILFHNDNNYNYNNIIFINCVFLSHIQFYGMTGQFNITFDSCVIKDCFIIDN